MNTNAFNCHYTIAFIRSHVHQGIVLREFDTFTVARHYYLCESFALTAEKLFLLGLFSFFTHDTLHLLSFVKFELPVERPSEQKLSGGLGKVRFVLVRLQGLVNHRL